MRKGKHLYFAPGITFSNVDTTGVNLPQQVGERIRGFYLVPARALAELGHAFASGVMLVTAIDALARLQTDRNDVGGRFQEWCTTHLSSSKDAISKRFYENFRCGLVHEARIKNGGEFSLDFSETFQENGNILSCNPTFLLAEVEAALNAYIRTLELDPTKLETLRHRICDDFVYEFRN
jgi:hypothetical protein